MHMAQCSGKAEDPMQAYLAEYGAYKAEFQLHA
jgi:hypothetical protein